MNKNDEYGKLVWKNIYYMITYTIKELSYFKLDDIDYEDIESTNDLLGVLLCKAFRVVLEHGYLNEYIEKEIETDHPHGKINVEKSYATGAINRGKMICTVHELNINNAYNQVIKASINILIKMDSEENKINNRTLTELNDYLDELNEVDDIDVDSSINNMYYDAPDNYKAVFVVCEYIINGWLACDDNGDKRLFSLDNRIRLRYIFEEFLRNYYKTTYINDTVSKPRWQYEDNSRQPDIVIQTDTNDIILDAKWYETDVKNRNSDQIIAYCTYHQQRYGKDKIFTGALVYASDHVTSNEKTRKKLMGREDAEHTGIAYDAFSYNLKINQNFESLKKDLNRIYKELKLSKDE